MCSANICRLNEWGICGGLGGGVIPGPLKKTGTEMLPRERVCVVAWEPHEALESLSQGKNVFAH